ncbi:MAG: AAA family ATPase, partial [Polyangiaceae bacterium]
MSGNKSKGLLGVDPPGKGRGSGAARPDAEQPSGKEAANSEPKTNGNVVPPAPWSEAALPDSMEAREKARVPAAKVTVHTDPALLPDEPKRSGGLFEIASPIARRALELGLVAREPSFHVFVAADRSVMIEADVVRHAERFARTRSVPSDIVYVHDFDNPAAPWPIMLPAGVGPILAESLGQVIDKLQEEIPKLAATEEVREAQHKLARELEQQNKRVLGDLETTAKTLGFGIRTVQGGMQTFPILHGKPLSAEQFDILDEGTKKALGEAETRLTNEVEKAAELVKSEGAKFQEARDAAFTHAAETLITGVLEQVTTAFREHGEKLGQYLEQVKHALIEDWDDLVVPDDENDAGGEGDPEHATRLNRFRVNVFVTHDPEGNAPVIYDTNPTYPNLFGYLERRARFGALLTDFTRIRAGSLHKASGGVLVVRASDVLADPILWERMKRVLRERQIGAEDPLGPLGVYATSLRPVPVPITVRVVLVGSPDLYAALLEGDDDFASLFRVKVEVEPSMPRTDQRLIALDAYLMAMARERDWGTFDKEARATLLDLATRLAGDQDKLSLSLAPLEETAAFASALATARLAFDDEDAKKDAPSGLVADSEAAPDSSRPPMAITTTAQSDDSPHSLRPLRASVRPIGKDGQVAVVTADDVQVAWRERRERAGAAERQIRDLTIRGEVVLETEGNRVGVVNGLSVYSAGDVEFGQPMRITAVVALGREGIVDVEREAQLGGAIHTKGVAILRGYLGRLFGQERPLSLRAQIAFEQSYGEIDGDSASSSELFSVLSALADVGIDQGIAVTGS